MLLYYQDADSNGVPIRSVRTLEDLIARGQIVAETLVREPQSRSWIAAQACDVTRPFFRTGKPSEKGASSTEASIGGRSGAENNTVVKAAEAAAPSAQARGPGQMASPFAKSTSAPTVTVQQPSPKLSPTPVVASALSRMIVTSPMPSSMSQTDILFSFDGRISRSTYWMQGMFPLLMASIVISLIPLKDIYAVLSIFLLFPCLAVGAKRCHDRGRSGWLQVLPYPLLIIGAVALGGRNSNFGDFLTGLGLIALVWVFIEMGFLRGTVGPNRFGPDPLQGSSP